MSEYTILTNAGRNAEAAALATGTALTIAEIAWGNGDRDPGGGETALLHEQGRQAVQASGVQEGTLNQAFFRTFIDLDRGPFVIREVGLFSSDGTMIALTKLDPPLEKTLNRTATLDIVFAFSNLVSLVIQLDTVSAFVPEERRIDTGDGLQGGGDLGEDRTIEVTFASQAQANAGTSEVTSISPKTLFGALQSLAALAGFTIIAGDIGAIRLPNWLGSFQLTWGRGTIPPSAALQITFPLAFTQANWAGVPTQELGSSAEYVGISSRSLAGAWIDNFPGARSVLAYWIFIGR